MKLPNQRDWSITYRFRLINAISPEKLYEVVQYIPSQPVCKIKGFYIWKTLPEWIKDAIIVLDVAGKGKYINNYGGRSTDIYWLPSKDDEKSK